MATFSAQVVDLVGTFSDETALDSFITEGANEVINAMPRSMRERVAEETSFTNTTSSEGSKVLHVLRNDGTIDQPCRRIPARYRGRIQDSSDMQYATTTDPAFYIQDALVTIFPTGTGKLVSIPTYNQGSALDASSLSTITNFPNEAEYLVTLYAAIKALQQNMSGKLSNSDITTAFTAVNAEIDECLSIADNVHTEIAIINSSADSALTEIGLANAEVDKMATEVGLDNAELDLAKAEIAEAAVLVDSGIDTATAAIATAAGRVNTAVLLANLEFDKVDNVILEGSAEFDEAKNLSAAYNSGQIATALDAVQANVDLANGIIDSPPVSPATPSLTSVTFTSIDSALNADSPVCSTAVVGSSSAYTGSAPTFTKPVVSPDFSQVNTYIDTDEDVELAQAKLQEINAQLSEYSTNIQNEQADFNKENVLYQSAIQESMQEVQISNQVNLAQAQSDLQTAISNKDRDQQRQLQNGVNDMQAIVQNNDDLMSKYSAEITEYQAKLGEMTQRAQGYLSTAQGYSNEVQSYATASQTFINTGNAYIQEANAITSQGNAYLQEASSSANEAQTYANEVSARVQQVQAQIGVAQGYIANGAGYSRVADGYGKTAQGYLGTASNYLQAAQGYTSSAQAYANEIQSKIGIAQAYGNEVQSRLAVDTTEYSWYEKQQAKLQQDYDKGLQILAGGVRPQ